MRRVVSLFLPHWSTDRLRRKTGKPRPDGAAPAPPLVTAIPDHGRRIVAAVDGDARALGIRPGMTITKARAFAPELDVVDAEPEADFEGLRRLALWVGARYSPVVAPDPPDGLWLDITGCAARFSTERALLKDLHRRTAAFGLSLQIAVADTAGCAHAVARYVPAGRPVTIEPGAHRKAVALLPIRALRLPPADVEALRKLGFERVEQLIGAPRGPLAKRFGRELHRRLDQALGTLPEPIEPIFPEQLPRARRGFMEPIATAEAFAQVIGDLARDIADQLGRLGKGARRLDCYFHRVDGQVQAIRVGTAAPSRDPKHLAKLLSAKIETIEPGLGIEAMTLVAPLVEVQALRQGESLESLTRRGPDLPALVDTLANRFGQRSLHQTMPRPGAMPERSVAITPALRQPDGATWSDELPRPSRMLARPEPVDVIALLPDDAPRLFVWRGKRYRVTQGDGPERLQGEWWRDGGIEGETPLSVCWSGIGQQSAGCRSVRTPFESECPSNAIPPGGRLRMVAAIAPDDCDTIANRLLDEFTSLGRIWSQPPERLTRFLARYPGLASFLTNVRDAMLEGMRSELRTVRIDPRNPSLCRYLIASMGSLPEERLRILFLDPARSLIADEEVQRGSLAQLAIYPRTIFRRALEHNAASIILVHNHPSGDPAPSAEDLSATRRLEVVGRALDVEILEHIIVTGTRTYNLIEGSAEVRPRGKFLPFFLRSHPDPADETDALAQRNAETAMRRRILRRQLLGNPKLFGEPAWDMLVDLFIHRSRGQPLSMSSLCITAAIPTSSAMKLIQRLCDAGILERSPDAHDGRRSLVSLTPEVAHRLRAYFAEGAE